MQPVVVKVVASSLSSRVHNGQIYMILQKNSEWVEQLFIFSNAFPFIFYFQKWWTLAVINWFHWYHSTPYELLHPIPPEQNS